MLVVSEEQRMMIGFERFYEHDLEHRASSGQDIMLTIPCI
jgi:hypothetical protein